MAPPLFPRPRRWGLILLVLGLAAGGASGARAVQRSCDGRRVYVHKLPSKFNTGLLYNKTRDHELPQDWYVEYMLNHLQRASANNGFGVQQRNENMGVPGLEGTWYDTDQNSLGVIFHARMLSYPCLVKDWTDSDFIYVPYFGGLDLLRTMHCGVEQRDRLALELVPWLIEHPAWQRFNGADHFAVMGRNIWDFIRYPWKKGGWGSKLLRMEGMVNTLFTILVETQELPQFERVLSAPKPTAFHPKNMKQVELWQDHVRSQDRKWLFSFAGGKRPGATLEGQLRAKLFWQCRRSRDCGLVDCTEFKKCETLSQFFELYLESTFCLHPLGDSCTRRSVLDGMLAGCIPVVFKDCTLNHQFKWHLNAEELGQFFVYIPLKDVKGPNNEPDTIMVQDILRAIPAKEVAAMRERVISAIPRIVYGGASKNGTIRSPDFTDSIELIIEGLVSDTLKFREYSR